MMASKSRSNPLNGAHTAGIFADMTIDGPEIGTLVAIVDRAKNLPNRKTIGKQDPYCAARLGKEAKKTSTDIRGGQTPKWDQELRFTVHDSPDYYQLKVSVFTDDKRTDLIGESWIDLKNIILSGGGQGDIWQSLTCRGKYAGEIRLEITYYDSRPKPEKPLATKTRQSISTEQDMGSSKQRTPMKRRPLPSDPISGEAPVTPPIHPASAPPKVSPGPDPYQTPPRGRAERASHAGFVPKQSPLQGLEYQTPPSAGRYQHPDQYPQASHAQQQQPPRHMSRQAETPPRNYDERDYSPRHSVSPYQQEARGHPDPYDGPGHDDGRPPPPPAHRTMNSGGYDTSPQKGAMRHDVLKNEAHRYSSPSYPGRPAFRGYDSAPAGPAAATPPQEPGYEPSPPRHHSYDASYDNHYHQRSLQPTVEDVPESPPDHYTYSQERHEPARPMYDDAAYDHSPAYSNRRSPAPAPMPIQHSTPSSRSPRPYDDPSNYHVSPSHHPPTNDFSTSPNHQSYTQNRPGHSEYAIEEEIHMQSSNYVPPALPASLVPGMDPNLTQDLHDRIYEERRHDRRYSDQTAMVPARGYPMAEAAPNFGSDALVTTRGRQMSETPSNYGAGALVSTRGRQMTDTPPSYNPGQRYDRRSSGITYSGGPEAQPQALVHRNVSPNPSPRHVIPRKSVSPVPPPPEVRRESEIPFGPDSFDAFNSNISSVREEQREAETADKIITHDGKEVDPSDHLPVESWAPEPEPKKQASPEPRARPAGAQPMPPSGRRQLRVAARPQPPPPTGPPRQLHGPQEPLPPSTGRNRLHKKQNRASYGPSATGPSPLAPITPENYQDRQGGYASAQSHHRHSHWDYPNENHAPHGSSGPPIPAKVPLPVMSGANGGPEDMALLAEMQRIDIGTGRSRRRGGY